MPLHIRSSRAGAAGFCECRGAARGAAVPRAAPGDRAASRLWACGLAAALAAGIALRLIWLRDVEFKADEAWTYAQIQAFWRSHALPPVGMISSAGLPNGGLSLWAFIALSAVLPGGGALALTRLVELVNIAGMLLLVLFALKVVGRDEREPWLWSAALVAVNPLAVLFSRKLWPPELFPPVTLALLTGWWWRRRWWGAFLWGLVGALLGQIELAGAFFAAALLGGVLLCDRRSVHWPAWLAGSAIGVLPLIPWLLTVASLHDAGAAQLQNPLAPFIDWLNMALGIGLGYSLGHDLPRFLAFPMLFGRASHLAQFAIAAVVLLFLAMLARLAGQWRNGVRLLATGSPTGLAVNAAFLGYPLLLLLGGHPIFLHYFIVTLPLPALWLARIALAGAGARPGSAANSRRLLAALVVVQAALALLFLAYIHERQVIAGDYGTAFGAQFDQRPP